MSAGEHAIVVGGSAAGLLAARVLSDFYPNVTIVERDQLGDEATHRKGTPQDQHIHALLARGQQILDRLFPGLMDELALAGAPVGDFGTSLRWYFGATMLRRTHTDMICVAAGRLLLEQRIRRRVAAIPGVRILDSTEVTGLLSDASRTRVTGVRVHRASEADGVAELTGDLVIDAAGRGTRLPVWLSELGYPEVARELIKVGLGYTTRYYEKFPDFNPLGEDIGILAVASPQSPRGATMGRLPGTHALVLTGLRGDHPPREHGAFLDFVASLPVPGIHRGIVTAEPTGPPIFYHFPASVRFHYERMKRLPEGVVALGDSLCTFNPTYGQGMTVGAIEADLLREHLERHGGARTAQLQRRLGRAVDVPWALSGGYDLAFPQAEGRRTIATRMGNAYIPRLQRAAATDPVLSRAFLRVAGLVDPPSTLMRPEIVARALKG
ncbi:FAD-dependent oxidoreductase [Streptomyces sp. NBC_01190]|uniref:FAD-dependent oxidoreductase n=1 Tax=Streptomyces sp. NBC_01190 TaxID=2903767 RepID=UPI0038683DF7|nr:FAD-binding monooxygenase [Streptomyces sp. NBC_01190]